MCPVQNLVRVRGSFTFILIHFKYRIVILCLCLIIYIYIYNNYITIAFINVIEKYSELLMRIVAGQKGILL